MAKKETNLTLGISEPEKVELFLNSLTHPMRDVVRYLRGEIISAAAEIGEGIYWNAPTFFYTGTMPPFDPKSYKRYLVGFVFNKQDCLRLVFLKGADVKDSAGLLEGTYSDGRRLMTIHDLADAKKKSAALKEIIKDLIAQLN
jgi:hypothetical protein